MADCGTMMEGQGTSGSYQESPWTRKSPLSTSYLSQEHPSAREDGEHLAREGTDTQKERDSPLHEQEQVPLVREDPERRASPLQPPPDRVKSPHPYAPQTETTITYAPQYSPQHSSVDYSIQGKDSPTSQAPEVRELSPPQSTQQERMSPVPPQESDSSLLSTQPIELPVHYTPRAECPEDEGTQHTPQEKETPLQYPLDTKDHETEHPSEENQSSQQKESEVQCSTEQGAQEIQNPSQETESEIQNLSKEKEAKVEPQEKKDEAKSVPQPEDMECDSRDEQKDASEIQKAKPETRIPEPLKEAETEIKEDIPVKQPVGSSTQDEDWEEVEAVPWRQERKRKSERSEEDVAGKRERKPYSRHFLGEESGPGRPGRYTTRYGRKIRRPDRLGL